MATSAKSSKTKKCRKISKLITASLTECPPLYKKPPKLSGSKAKGKTYERAVGKLLRQWAETGELYGKVYEGQWFSFVDANGSGCCQPDILVETDSFVIILECKLTQNREALEQLAGLYRPVVEKVFQKPSVLVQVCRNLRHVPPTDFIRCVTELLDRPAYNTIYTWHFLAHARI